MLPSHQGGTFLAQLPGHPELPRPSLGEGAPVPHQVLSVSHCPAANRGTVHALLTATEREWSALRPLTPSKGAHQRFYILWASAS